MALISGSILVLMWILGHDFSGHYNRLVLISVDIISGVYCINRCLLCRVDSALEDQLRTATIHLSNRLV